MTRSVVCSLSFCTGAAGIWAGANVPGQHTISWQQEDRPGVTIYFLSFIPLAARSTQ